MTLTHCEATKSEVTNQPRLGTLRLIFLLICSVWLSVLYSPLSAGLDLQYENINVQYSQWLVKAGVTWYYVAGRNIFLAVWRNHGVSVPSDLWRKTPTKFKRCYFGLKSSLQIYFKYLAILLCNMSITVLISARFRKE